MFVSCFLTTSHCHNFPPFLWQFLSFLAERKAALWLKMTRILVTVLLATLSLNIVNVGALPRHTGIILLGGTGDLAHKYLWQALFDAYIRREVTEGVQEDHEPGEPWMFTLIAGGTSHSSVAANKLKVGVVQCFFLLDLTQDCVCTRMNSFTLITSGYIAVLCIHFHTAI